MPRGPVRECSETYAKREGRELRAIFGGTNRWGFTRRPFSDSRSILVQLNRGEGRHQLARTIFHGKRGELRQRYREGQEDQLGALGILVNLVVLWNTIYMDAALDRLRAEGHDVLSADVARLSPLGFKHINMLGRYALLSRTWSRGASSGPFAIPAQ